MPEITKSLLENRGWSPLVRVKLTPNHAGGISIEGVGLIDTGASMTSIDEYAAQTCRFRPTGKKVDLYTAGSRRQSTDLYSGRLEILEEGGYTEVIEMPIFNGKGQPLDDPPRNPFIALIGLDIIRRGSLLYDGKSGTFTLSLP